MTQFNQDMKHQLWGWILFLVCAIFFIASGLKNQDILTIAGSVVFFIACILFMIPLVTSNKRRDENMKASSENVEIPEEAITRSLAWIEGLEDALGTHGDPELVKTIMRAAGGECARKTLEACEHILGKSPETVDELIYAHNQRLSHHLDLDGIWHREGNRAFLKISQCGCPLVKAGLARPNPTHCVCTVGLIETLFSTVCLGNVTVEVIGTLGGGHDACEFEVTFLE